MNPKELKDLRSNLIHAFITGKITESEYNTENKRLDDLEDQIHGMVVIKMDSAEEDEEDPVSEEEIIEALDPIVKELRDIKNILDRKESGKPEKVGIDKKTILQIASVLLGAGVLGYAAYKISDDVDDDENSADGTKKQFSALRASGMKVNDAFSLINEAADSIFPPVKLFEEMAENIKKLSEKESEGKENYTEKLAYERQRDTDRRLIERENQIERERKAQSSKFSGGLVAPFKLFSREITQGLSKLAAERNDPLMGGAAFVTETMIPWLMNILLGGKIIGGAAGKVLKNTGVVKGANKLLGSGGKLAKGLKFGSIPVLGGMVAAVDSYLTDGSMEKAMSVMSGSMAGGIVGTMLGSMGGPVGAFLGGTIGTFIGEMLGDKLGDQFKGGGIEKLRDKIIHWFSNSSTTIQKQIEESLPQNKLDLGAPKIDSQKPALDVNRVEVSKIPEIPPATLKESSPQKLAKVHTNPGNLRKSAVRWLGEKDTTSDFSEFENPTYGVRAMAKTLMTYQNKHKISTIRDIVNKYAPTSDKNNVESYIKFISNKTGIAPTAKLNLNDKTVLMPLMEAMIEQEVGKENVPTKKEIDDGIKMAFSGVDKPGKQKNVFGKILDFFKGIFAGKKPTSSKEGLNVKGGVSPKSQAFSGGQTKVGTLAMAHAIQSSIPNFQQFTGFNDTFHQKHSPGSKHTKGLAMDFTVASAREADAAVQKVKEMMAEAGISGKVMNEYSNPSRKSTGPHIHVEFDSDSDASKFESHVANTKPTFVSKSLELNELVNPESQKSAQTSSVEQSSGTRPNSKLIPRYESVVSGEQLAGKTAENRVMAEESSGKPIIVPVPIPSPQVVTPQKSEADSSFGPMSEMRNYSDTFSRTLYENFRFSTKNLFQV